MNIDELAKKTIEEIIKLYKQNKISKKEIEELLKNYSDEVKKEIEEKLQQELGEFYFNNTNPEIAVTPLKLSEMLYTNAKNIAKEVGNILDKSIKAKETMGEISKKLYEGYGFRDKEVLDAVRVLPKYLQEAVKKRDKSIIKDIEKLKTKPLRIAYKNIIKKMDKLSDEALENHLRTAYHEKIRYYAKRIADTETHRAMMSKRANEYLNDEEIEFVKFTMSSRHPKTDICDFYANLDMGYGAGIIPKREMRTTPLHPHCYDAETEVYTNKGWKKFKDLKMNEMFLSFNPQDKEIEFVKATNFVCWLNNDKMISFKHKHFDLMVTDKHKMVVYKRVFQNKKRVKKIQFIEADKCLNSEFSIPRSAIWSGIAKDIIKVNNYEFNSFDFCEFMGYWLSDGSVTKRGNSYQITIAQQNNQERIYKVIQKLGFNPYYAKGYVGFSNKYFGEYLMQFGKAKDKFIPIEIKNLSSEFLWKFLEAFVSCDGNIRPEKDFKGYKTKPELVFYSSSKKMADDLGELILKCGYQPSFYLQKSKGKEINFRNGKYTINEDIWIIRLKRSQNANVSNLEIKEVEYNDYVYCVELEKYNILWVRRNGKTCFSGNCHCFYAPYYRQVKGKKKSFKSAVNETMNKFSEREQREILATSAMLERFKAGEDIEEVFNTIRPKYPIKKYIDIISKNIEDVSVDIKTMLDEIKAKNRLTKNKIVVGILNKQVIEFLEEKDIPIHTKEIYLTHKGLSHLARDSKKQRGAGLVEEDILRIPEILKTPSAVFFDNNKDKLNLLYCDNRFTKCIKLVIDTKFKEKKNILTVIKTAGYINSSDLKHPLLEILYGSWSY